MSETTGVAAEVERAERMASLLNDAASQDLLKRYLREVEYDLVYCADDPERHVTI